MFFLSYVNITGVTANLTLNNLNGLVLTFTAPRYSDELDLRDCSSFFIFHSRNLSVNPALFISDPKDYSDVPFVTNTICLNTCGKAR